MIDEADWEQAAFDVQGFAEEAGLAARLAGVSERLRSYRQGDADAGALAADALDQLAGVLGDLERDLPRVRQGVDYLMRNLPPTRD